MRFRRRLKPKRSRSGIFSQDRRCSRRSSTRRMCASARQTSTSTWRRSIHARPSAKGDLRRAQQIFKRSRRSRFAVDLADLTRDAWTLLPGPDDFLAGTHEAIRHAHLRALSVGAWKTSRSSSASGTRTSRNLSVEGQFENAVASTRTTSRPSTCSTTTSRSPRFPTANGLTARRACGLRARAASLGQLNLRLADSAIVRSV